MVVYYIDAYENMGGEKWGAVVRHIAVVVIAIVGSIAVVCGLGPVVAVVKLVGVLVAVLVPLWCALAHCDCSRYGGVVIM